jgi:hypothetical protein
MVEIVVVDNWVTNGKIKKEMKWVCVCVWEWEWVEERVRKNEKEWKMQKLK